MVRRSSRSHRKPMKRTEGRRLLLVVLAKNTEHSVATSVKASQQAVSSWKKGSSRPETHFRDALERVYGIPRDSWLTAGELAIARGCEEPLAATGTDGE